MAEQPRVNEDRFYRYPMHRVVAIIDDERRVGTALHALQQAGLDVTAVNVLSGPDGARLLDRTGAQHGLRARLLRLTQRGAYEGTALQAHESALNNGQQVIYVPVQGDPERRRVVDILRAAGGHDLLHFRRWGVEELRF
jgi:hypothetical protein